MDQDFKFESLPIEKLQGISFDPKEMNEATIQGIYVKDLKRNVDGRGDLTELWSELWSQTEPIAGQVKHVYWNTTHLGVIKGWHVHEHTESQYTCVVGKLQIILTDVREHSPTFGHVNQFIVGSHLPTYMRIPPGVLKAWKGLQGDSVIVNLLTSANTDDNFRYPWNAILSHMWEPKFR